LITVLVFVLAYMYYTIAECKILTKPNHLKFLEQLRTTCMSGSCANLNFLTRYPVKIRFRIYPPLVCRKRRLNPLDETGKTEVPCHSRCGTIKITPCSKAISAEHRHTFCSPSPAMVTSPYKSKILERDVKH
jgi:hypothetical protein